ncbi:MAG TPA: L-asparaginase 1 [Alteromonas australica]|jgi:L-asparaginase|uniref:L-asparaginase 1 n=1 Tax=Alteromonas australica TaxID=589873 RepID=A0A350P7G2_9ALTE|nr:asparaginase [Alteromonas australica]MAF71134.1 L-asparaginase 1 [Alteromonas sp.]MBU33616.1 L-asparaginase 1 [Alteromonas sp.]HAI71160.1 L-asparaginase 1 [Alteromonas australica]HAW77229.1 L-asparaginase 1 [Alteromonas australica]HBF72751.1 L-asparaginase 1 [Alteromonas australica]|tara:strand:- start:1330 stop:2337 length:1008 start_codon:yes stop_codon:yes gene_type:complete
MRKHIYIAYTGGTIGMKPSDQGYIPAAGFLSETLAQMPEFHRPEMPLFTLHEYDNLIDSSDMNPSDWQRIADDIAANYDKYDGFIILHGTDTMAYTSSALSFMLENLSKPVIVTGSQIPLAELRSDGQVNLLNALYVAANYPIAEVSLFFNNRLLRGNRSRKVDADGFNAFDSPNFPPLLEAGINIRLKAGELATPSDKPLRVSPVKAQPIGMVSLYPGIASEVLKNTLQQPVNALILLSYGVGNAPQSPSLIAQLNYAKDREIPVLNCTQCIRGRVNMGGYATGHGLQQAGVLSGSDMTPEAALAKLHYLLSKSLSFSQLKSQLTHNLRGELSE